MLFLFFIGIVTSVFFSAVCVVIGDFVVDVVVFCFVVGRIVVVTVPFLVVRDVIACDRIVSVITSVVSVIVVLCIVYSDVFFVVFVNVFPVDADVFFGSVVL